MSHSPSLSYSLSLPLFNSLSLVLTLSVSLSPSLSLLLFLFSPSLSYSLFLFSLSLLNTLSASSSFLHTHSLFLSLSLLLAIFLLSLSLTHSLAISPSFYDFEVQNIRLKYFFPRNLVIFHHECTCTQGNCVPLIGWLLNTFSTKIVKQSRGDEPHLPCVLVYSQLGFPRPPKLVPQTFVWRPPFSCPSAQGDDPTIPHFVKPSTSAPQKWYMVFLSFWWPQNVTLDAPSRRRDGPNAPFFGVVFSQTFSKPKSLRYTTNIPPQKVNGFSRLVNYRFQSNFGFHYILHNKFSELQETEIQKYSQK